MNIRKQLAFGCFLATLMFALFPSFVLADEVILDPGYLQGAVTVGSFNVDSLQVQAYNSQYSSSVYTGGNTYAMTLYGGQTYDVSMAAYSWSPYTSLYFKNRTVSVEKGETVTNDYTVSNPGAIRFQLTISGATYSNWTVYGYASADPASGEQTYSESYAQSGTSPSGEWIMPVVPNESVQIYAYVYVDGKPYRFYTDGSYYQDIDPGEEVVVPLNLTHVAPRGTVEGTISLGSVGDRFSRHYLYVYPSNQSATGYESHYDYSIAQVVSGSQLYAYTYMDNDRTSLRWPYPGGDYNNTLLSLDEGDTLTRDYVAEAGGLGGKIAFTGTLTNTALSDINLTFSGINNTRTSGGYARTSNFDSQGNYHLFLTPGTWEVSYLSVSESLADYYRSYSRSMYVYDYAQPSVEIVAGAETPLNRNYCTGSLAVGFQVEGGGAISSPYIEGSMSKQKPDGSWLSTYTYSYSYGYSENPENPVVEINGIEGPHQFDCYGTLADGSTPKFGTLYVTLECGVKKGQELGSPTITIAAPSGQVITAASSIEVSGTATDESGVAAIAINGNPASFDSSYNPEDPNEVAFSATIDLNPGANVIRTEVTDTSELTSFDERTVLVDSWQPELAWVAPEASYNQGMSVPVEVVGSDRGYGAILQVYLDGSPLGEKEIAGNDIAEATATFTDSLSGLAVGSYTLTAVVTDQAGNSEATTRSFEVVSNSQVVGNGYLYPVVGYRANVNLTVVGDEGFLKYYFTKTRMSFASTAISSLAVNGLSATVTGSGAVNGVGGYTFTATVADGSPDTFGLTIRNSSGAVYYSLVPTRLAGGDLTITP